MNLGAITQVITSSFTSAAKLAKSHQLRILATNAQTPLAMTIL